MNVFKIINRIKKAINPERFDFEEELAKLNKKRKIQGVADYYDVKDNVMFAYCDLYGGYEDGVPVKYLPHTTMYKTIAKRLTTIERTLKIKNITTNIKRNVRKNK